MNDLSHISFSFTLIHQQRDANDGKSFIRSIGQIGDVVSMSYDVKDNSCVSATAITESLFSSIFCFFCFFLFSEEKKREKRRERKEKRKEEKKKKGRRKKRREKEKIF